ncbi:hypothetical protein PsorP6_013537 [Peronosclerospora sorghi]|uniref:Uncharacterized protein n=1 Tax=Peronosclerospora sorghi TaxID=230839 RepID=A0ACC0VH77_9STRA|nr:hypothetical protein PsorP6_013537 [Peronosclerospora sorghi]
MTNLFVIWQLVALFSSLVSGIAMVYFFMTYPSSRVHPGLVLMSIFMSVNIASSMRVAMHAWYTFFQPDDIGGPMAATLSRIANEELGHDVGTLESYVPFFFWCYFFFTTSATLWFLMLALDLIFSLSNPFLPFNADNAKHHIYAWPCSLLYCLVFRYMLSAIQDKTTANVVLYFHFPAYLVLLYISIALIQCWRRARILETHAHATTRQMAQRILPYLAVFALHTLVALLIYLLEVGFVFGRTTPNAMDQLSLVLETLALFTLFCRDAGVLEQVYVEDERDNRETHLSLSQMSQYTNPREKIDVSNKLRMDVMRYMSMGIMKSIEMAQTAENKARRASGRERDVTESTTEVASWHRGECMNYDDYTYVKSMGVVVYGLKHSTMLNFRDCAPKVFHRIRAQFQIDQDFYRESFDPSRILSEHGSEGKSGNTFYFTGTTEGVVSMQQNVVLTCQLLCAAFLANKQFMVKSVPRDEFETLRAILPHYHEYLQSNPHSMLCRYFGCHSISLPIGKRRMYFVVMQNLFHAGPVDQRFDLKGNRDRRQAVRGTTEMKRLIQAANEKKTIKQLLMDMDFLKMRSGMCLSYGTTVAQQDQLCSDVLFLASRGILDYSILLGVAYLRPEQHQPYDRGMVSYDANETYYVGIVDMLQRYNWRWTLQRWVLGSLLCKNTHDVSAVPPEEYATRLADFVRDKLFHLPCPGEARDGEEQHGYSRSSCDSGQSSIYITPPMSLHCSIDMARLSTSSLATSDMEMIHVGETPTSSVEVGKSTQFFVELDDPEEGSVRPSC